MQSKLSTGLNCMLISYRFCTYSATFGGNLVATRNGLDGLHLAFVNLFPVVGFWLLASDFFTAAVCFVCGEFVEVSSAAHTTCCRRHRNRCPLRCVVTRRFFFSAGSFFIKTARLSPKERVPLSTTTSCWRRCFW